MWIDLVPHLRRLGPVISVDLPGTVTGHTRAGYRRGPRPDLDARFVSAFLRRLGLEHVVLHGWSMGGLVAALAAGLMPHKVRGVVLLAPALPWRLTSRVEVLGWQTLGRLAVAAGPPTARLALRVAGRRILDAKRPRSAIPARWRVAVPACSAEIRAVSHRRRSTCGSTTSTRPASTPNDSSAQSPRSRPSPGACSSPSARRTRHSTRYGHRCWCCGDSTIRWSTPRRSCGMPDGGAGHPDLSTGSATCYPSRRPTAARSTSANGSPTSTREQRPQASIGRSDRGARAAGVRSAAAEDDRRAAQADSARGDRAGGPAWGGRVRSTHTRPDARRSRLAAQQPSVWQTLATVCRPLGELVVHLGGILEPTVRDRLTWHLHRIAVFYRDTARR